MKWWKLKKEDCRVSFRVELRQALGGQEVLPVDWMATPNRIGQTDTRIISVSCGRKSDKKTWWWNEEMQVYVYTKRLAKKKWDTED